MDKRYQVFVSSTYRDLVEFRQFVMKTLMQVNAIPAGMEMFPAADDDAWTLIRRTIDESDYYVVILGGRYGSVSPETGVGYTEMEYDYAVERGKPVMAFLHRDPTRLARDKTETDPALWQRLQQFRTKTEHRHCKYWETDAELLAAVMTSYHQMVYTHPATGWVRGDQAKTIADVERLAAVQQRVAELEAENVELKRASSDGTESFASGDERLTLTLRMATEDADLKVPVETTWNALFRAAGRSMLRNQFEPHIISAVFDDLEAHARLLKLIPPERTVKFPKEQEIDTIKHQLMALKLIDVDYEELIESGGGDREIRTWYPTWKLTPRGRDYLARLLAVPHVVAHVTNPSPKPAS